MFNITEVWCCDSAGGGPLCINMELLETETDFPVARKKLRLIDTVSARRHTCAGSDDCFNTFKKEGEMCEETWTSNLNIFCSTLTLNRGEIC